MMKRFRKILHYFKSKDDDQGQILLFVLLVVFVLLFILFAIILVVKTDISETIQEREYEEGYALAEEELFKIGADGFADWSTSATQVANVGNFCPPSDSDQPCCCYYNGSCVGATQNWECWQKTGLGENGNGETVVKRCELDCLAGLRIDQDETLEVSTENVTAGALDSLRIDWDSPATAVSIIVVYVDGGVYKSRRIAMCRQGNNGCYAGFKDYDSSLSVIGDFGVPNTAFQTKLIRVRAIGGDAENVLIYENSLPAQMEIIRSQAFPAGQDKEISAPEVYTEHVLADGIPSLFDYVLFVDSGGVTKP